MMLFGKGAAGELFMKKGLNLWLHILAQSQHYIKCLRNLMGVFLTMNHKNLMLKVKWLRKLLSDMWSAFHVKHLTRDSIIHVFEFSEKVASSSMIYSKE